MNTSKLVELLQSIGDDEFFYLKDFVHSPYHNKNKQVTALFDYLAKVHPFYKADVVNREKVFEYLFPGQSYDDLKIRHAMSLLQKVVEAFLVQQSYKQQQLEQQLLLAESLRKKQLQKHYKGAVRGLERLHKKEEALSDNQLWLHYQLEEEQEEALQSKQERRSSTNLQNTTQALDNFYLLKKLQLTCNMVNYSNILKQEYEDEMTELLLDHLESQPNHHPLIQLYHAALLSLLNPDEAQHYQSLKQLLMANTDTIAAKHARELQAIARNYCIRQLNTGQSEYIPELFSLYKLAMSRDVIKDEEGNLPAATFKNVVAVALNQKAYGWAEQFINEQSPYLDNKLRDDYVTYNLAKVNYERKAYDAVIQCLQKIETYHDIFVSADARTLLAKTYYEAGEWDTLDSLLDSFKRFINRHKELNYHKENYNNFIRLTQKMMKVRPSQKAREQLIQQVKDTKVLTEQAWFLQQLA